MCRTRVLLKERNSHQQKNIWGQYNKHVLWFKQPETCDKNYERSPKTAATRFDSRASNVPFGSWGSVVKMTAHI